MDIFGNKKAFNKGFHEGYNKHLEETIQRKKDYDKNALNHYIGRPLIVVPNEWCNPIVGFGKCVEDFGHSKVLRIENYLGEEISDCFCSGIIMDFSYQKFDVSMMLDPYQLWAILAVNSVSHENFDKPKSGHRNTPEECRAMLEKNGFFKRADEFISNDSF